MKRSLLLLTALSGACEADIENSEADGQTAAHVQATVNTLNPALDRADQRDLPLDGDYLPPNEGGGVTVYVIAGGIRATHSKFEGRVSPGHSVVPDSDAHAVVDCEGTGTKLAGLVGSSPYGAAPGVEFVPVRAFDCSSLSASPSQIVQALDWIRAQNRKPAVVLLPLRATQSSVDIDRAVARLNSAGVAVVTPAGHTGTDECTAPGRITASNLIVAGGTSGDDSIASGSNRGRCVDVFAPSVRVTTTAAHSDNGVALVSGNANAAAYVAGAAALLLSEDRTLSPTAVRNTLMQRASWRAGVPVLYVGLDTEPGGEPRSQTFSGSVTQGQFKRFAPKSVRPGSVFNATLTSATGDADLFVRFDQAPTNFSYDCRPFLDGDEREECTLTVPNSVSTVHVGVRGFNAGVSSYQIRLQWVEPGDAANNGGSSSIAGSSNNGGGLRGGTAGTGGM